MTTLLLSALGGRALERDREPRKGDCPACQATATFFLLGWEHTPTPTCPRCGQRWEVLRAGKK